jgi:alkylated DNA repair dioxygenase AlkB
MQTIEILSPVECDRLMTWCFQQELNHEIFTGQMTCRKQRWWGFEAEFYFNRSHIYERPPIESDAYLATLRDRFEPGADSILLYKYEINGSIGEHLDKQCFQPQVTLINLVDDSPNLFGERPTTRFRWGRENYELRHGEIVNFNSRVLHSVPKLKSARYSLQFRRIAR